MYVNTNPLKSKCVYIWSYGYQFGSLYSRIVRIVWPALGFMQTLVSLSIAESFNVLTYNFDLDWQNLGINLEI